MCIRDSIYTRDELPIAERAAIVARSGGASQSDLGLSYWGPGDLWILSLIHICAFEARLNVKC